MHAIRRPLCSLLAFAAAAVGSTVPATSPFAARLVHAQEEGISARHRAVSLRVEPPALELALDAEAQLSAILVDAQGGEVEGAVFFLSRARRSLSVTPDGRVTALAPGDFSVVVIAPGPEGMRDERTLRVDVPVKVLYPPAATIELAGLPERLYAGAAARVQATAHTAGGLQRPDLEPEFRSSDPGVMSVDAFGWVTAGEPGRATLEVRAGEARLARAVEVVANPVRSVAVSVDRTRARTGDVLHFEARALDAAGEPVPDAPILFSLVEQPIDTLRAPPSAAQVDATGAFVAEKPGLYTVVASSGTYSGRVAVMIDGREVAQEVALVGRGAVTDVHTSDLWVWEGVGGRDYAITGTWGGRGVAYFWDVTDPATPLKVDSVQVDARTVNDVKISEDGRVGVISREGASNRRNGIVILDVSDPGNVQVLSEFDDELTGGVHNVFVYENHVYAVNNGRRYDIINIEDPRNPRRVGRFELDTPGHSIHDVWVEDGIAYSSNWGDGVVLVDVGNGIAGGSPSNPVKIASYAYPSGANHAAFPYRSESTGKFYVIAGDEIFPEGLNVEGTPVRAAGYIHFIDFTDLENPREVARYEVPEAGTHNLWVEGDRLYVAYYNGGLRVVDISGELRGDLYRQGREIARFMPHDPEGVIANAPMAWGPQPHKGHLFFSDWNSGLWSVRLQPRRDLVP